MRSSSAQAVTRSSACRRSVCSPARSGWGAAAGRSGARERKPGRTIDTPRKDEDICGSRGALPAMPLIETEEAARRLARAIASDVSLYNEEKIVRGLEHDSLFEELGEEIEEGRALYKSRVSPDLYHKNFYDRALVDILIRSKGHVKSRIW